MSARQEQAAEGGSGDKGGGGMQITDSLKSWKFVLYCCLLSLQMQKSEILWQVLSVEDSF